MSVVIDNFGWFYAKTSPLSLTKLIGLILVVIGIMVTIALPSILSKRTKQAKTTNKSKKLIWQIIALLDGFAFSIESTINGHVGTVLKTPIYSAFLTFIIASIILIFVNLFQGNFKYIKYIPKEHTPWWNFLGGIIGGINIFINAFLVPQIGIGLATILGLLGQIIISLIIDNWGFLGAEINKINKLQITGILTIILGIITIELI